MPDLLLKGSSRLRTIASVFLKLGLIGFGGPAVHIAMMEDEVVRRRGWLTREKFLDLVGATNLIPGPTSNPAPPAGHLVCTFFCRASVTLCPAALSPL